MAQPSSLPQGIWAPTQAFFHDETGDLDTGTIGRHAVRLARAGIVGIVTNGSNGESVHLTPAERAQVTRVTRDALDAAGFAHVPIMAGASDQSLRGTLSLIADAHDAGAAAVLLLSPSYFRWAMSVPAIEAYFTATADASPLPVFIYNYPAAAGGIDLDSETLARLARHPNIVGTKFTCGNMGKLARVVAAVATAGREDYLAFSGVADAITPALTVGGHGGIVGAANVFPRACINVYRLYNQGKVDEARAAQQQLALADWTLTKRAIPGFKAILQKYHGYGGLPRQPVQPLSPEEEKALFAEISQMVVVEESLQDFGQSTRS
ncbi:Aldolase [Pleurostoma richardsiae]|uniref:Aldolase n=1 Tax=Pleurostoma richardsiae TaxID=41990 RepID=A0AA38RJ91_9PEZI|nr:Aldolase [Pleurostoma richardsiae]